MDFHFSVLVHNPMREMRTGLVETTLSTGADAFSTHPRCVYDNGSSDGSSEWLRSLCSQNGFDYVLLDGENTTPGGGRAACIAHCRAVAPPKGVVVWSDDDMEWREDAAGQLAEAWANAPGDVALIGGSMEPLFAWNTPRDAVDCGSARILIRDSTPGQVWTFSAAQFALFASIVEKRFGYDYQGCLALGRLGKRIGQLDLADHIGWGYSTHGNAAVDDVNARPLDREKWGV